jgi:hypothetical protein
MAMRSWRVFVPLPWGRLANWNIIVLLARDLKLVKIAEYDELIGQVTELKRMLTGFYRKLKADS